MHLSGLIKTSLVLALAASVLSACGKKEEAAGTDAIKLMFIGQITDTANATPTPEAAEGVRAAVAAINAAGGVAGRQLHLDVCDDKADANEAAKCARRAVREGIVATVGNSSNFGGFLLPVLEQARIASIGHTPLTPRDFASSSAFPLQAGSPGMIAGAARLLASQGVKRIRVAGVDSPAGAAGEQFVRKGLKGTDAELVGQTLVPIGAPDYAIYAKTLWQDADAVILAMNADQAARMITALRQEDSSKPIATTAVTLPPATITQLGAAAEGILVAAPFLPLTAKTASVEAFLRDMQTHAPQAKVNAFSQQGWLAVQAFKALVEMEPMGEITAPAVLTRMGQLDGLDVGDMIAPYVTLKENVPPFNRLFNCKLLFGRVENGEIVLIDNAWHEVSLSD